MKKLSSPTQSLQAASDVRFIQSRLRKNANVQILYACVLLCEAVLRYPEAGAIVSMLGAVVLGVEAMWLLRSRRPAPILGAAIVLWAAGLWNIYQFLRAPAPSLSSAWIFLALLYFYFGIREFATYRKFRAALHLQTPEAAAELEEILSTFTSEETSLLQPHVNGDRWQILLLDNGVAMRSMLDGAMLIGDRDTTQVEAHGKTITGGLRRITMRLRDKKLSCTFHDAEADSILAWSAGAHTPAHVSAAGRC